MNNIKRIDTSKYQQYKPQIRCTTSLQISDEMGVEHELVCYQIQHTRLIHKEIVVVDSQECFEIFEFEKERVVRRVAAHLKNFKDSQP